MKPEEIESGKAAKCSQCEGVPCRHVFDALHLDLILIFEDGVRPTEDALCARGLEIIGSILREHFDLGPGAFVFAHKIDWGASPRIKEIISEIAVREGISERP